MESKTQAKNNIERILSHLTKGENTKDVVSWYGYMPKNDIAKLLKHALLICCRPQLMRLENSESKFERCNIFRTTYLNKSAPTRLIHFY